MLKKLMINHMDGKEYDTWSDELNCNSFIDNGHAILKRRYIKGDQYLTSFDNSPITAEGITAFLFSNSYVGGLQLPPLNFSGAIEDLDIGRYYQHYFDVCKNSYLRKEKSKPNSVHCNLDKEFLVYHYNQEKEFFSKYRNYFKSISENPEGIDKKLFVKSYLKWVKNKRKPLKLSNYLELTMWGLLCLLIMGIIFFQLLFVDREWNIVQNINNIFRESDDLQKQIISYLLLAFIGSFTIAFLRIRKILNRL